MSKALRVDALDAFFRYNRISVWCQPERCLQWLKRFPRHALQRARQLDVIVVKKEPFSSEQHDERVCGEIMALIEFIAANFNLDRLFLSLDLRHFGTPTSRVDVIYNPRIRAAEKYTRDVGRTLSACIAKELRPGLNRFQVYAEGIPQLEDELKSLVMGSNFDAYHLGKIPKSLRAFYLPHKMDSEALLFGEVVSRPYPEEDGQGLVQHVLLERERVRCTIYMGI